MYVRGGRGPCFVSVLCWPLLFHVVLESFLVFPRGLLYSASKGRPAKVCRERVGRARSVKGEGTTAGGWDAANNVTKLSFLQNLLFIFILICL